MNRDSSLGTSLPFGLSGTIGSEPIRGNGIDQLAGDRQPEPQTRPGTEAVISLRSTLLTLVRRDGRDLTARQLTAFMTVYLDTHVHTVSSMAELLNISRPGVTRILDRLAEYDLVARQEDREDRRRVLIRRTVRGTAFLHELEDIAAASAQIG